MIAAMSPVSVVSPPVRRSTLDGAPSTSSSQANLGVRTSCNFCRDKKIRCSKTSVEEGGCDRCRREGVECRYDVRAPIGRPKKRKVEDVATATASGTPTNGRNVANGFVARRMSSSSLYSNTTPLASPSIYAHSPASFVGGSQSNSVLQSSRTSWPHHQQDAAPASSPHSNATTVWAHSSAQQQSEAPYTPTFSRSDDAQHARSQSLLSPSALSQSFNTSVPPASVTSSTSRLPNSTAPTSPTKATSAMEAPNLADLGLAAFLESLDTLEIKREDGLTPNMLAALSAAPSGSANGVESSGGGGALTQHATVDGNTSAVTTAVPPSHSDWTAASHLSLANMFGSISYAVPADLSWADPSWLDQVTRPTHNGNGGGLNNMPSTDPVAMLPPSWPRGAEAGMGLGELRTPDGRPIHPVPPMQSTSESATAGNGDDASSAPCAKTGKPKCCCSGTDADLPPHNQGTTTNHAAPHKAVAPSFSSSKAPPHSTTRVHCVPNPTGRGCTCLCDVSVALINVRTTLRQARGDERDASEASSSAGNPAVNGAASTLQLTLSASQAVTAHCACSASCPTCRTDPSTSLSASLLVSTALQIYVRAVRTLRQGFGAPDTSRGAAAASSSSGSDWDVSIGQYKPMATNARRIALFAMKLELRDLRDAIAKVSRAACGSSFMAGSEVGPNGDHDDGDQNASATGAASLDDEVNPIDRLVIRKLHQQLGDLLRTVEGIEEQQDAERNASSVESL